MVRPVRKTATAMPAAIHTRALSERSNAPGSRRDAKNSVFIYTGRVETPNVKLRGAPLLARPSRTPCYALLWDRPLRVPCNFPQVTIGVLEIACVTAPKSVLGRFYDNSPSILSLLHHLIDFCF